MDHVILRAYWSTLVWILVCGALALPARAQDAAAPAPSDEVIADPELAGIAAPEEPAAPPPVPNGEMRIVLRSRLGMDLQWQDPREDIWEATQIALFEARVRRSERLLFSLGLRARHLFAAREHDTPDADADRYELDIAPTAAYADVGLSDTVHLRIGYQSVQLGRFDVLNPSDILSARDLRSGPTTMPEASEIAQPAVRMDWDATDWLSLRVIALPFFEPHRVNAFDGDYALSITKQADVDARYEAAYEDPAERARAQRLVRNTLSRSGQERLGEGTLSAFVPEASFTSPQGALRVLAHGSAGEVGLTAGTALEHMPVMDFSPAFLAYIDQDPGMPGAEEAALFADPSPVEVRYNRFGLFSLDAMTPLGPLQLGAEVAFILQRTLLAAQTGALPLAERSDMLHAGVRLEYMQSDDVLFAIEASGARALQAPSAGSRFLFLTKDRFMLAAVAFIAHSPGDLGLTFELSGGVLNGPSYLLAPRIEQELVETLYAEVGAYVIDGKRTAVGDPLPVLGGIYGDADQVFVGLRWTP